MKKKHCPGSNRSCQELTLWKSDNKNTAIMDEQFDFKKKYRNILLILLTGGILVSLATILITRPGASRIWSNVLLNNQYFMGLSLGAAFFLAVHRVSQSGWH